MVYESVSLLNVYLDSCQKYRKVGRLARRNRQILFEYDPEFVASGLEISPLKLPLRPGVQVSDTHVYEGLHGVFNDSLPDGWGRLLLDRAVERHGILRGELGALDRLSYVGRNGMGALCYEPELGDQSKENEEVTLERIAEESARVLAGERAEVIEELLRLNGSSAGARPKILVQVSTDKGHLIHASGQAQEGYEDWIIKFPSSEDLPNIGAVEYAYSHMALAAGIEVADTYLFDTGKNRYFGTKRFDRKKGSRRHMHTLGGLIHSDHRTPSLDYDMLLRVTQVLTRDVREVEKAFALACFNVLAHNRDDHSKNFSYLMTDRGEWVFAPGYDLVFSYGPGGEQSMLVLGEGREPGIVQLLALGKKHGLRDSGVIIEQVRAAVGRWKYFAEEAGVDTKTMREIAGRLEKR